MVSEPMTNLSKQNLVKDPEHFITTKLISMLEYETPPQRPYFSSVRFSPLESLAFQNVHQKQTVTELRNGRTLI
jgi:hypothetical protein